MSATQILLISPLLEDADAFADALRQALEGAPVPAVLLRLAASDERSLVNRVKALAPIAQEREAALVVSVPDAAPDLLAVVAARGGADGVHLEGGAKLPTTIRALREGRKDERIVGVGRLRSRDDAMNAGEAGADYLLFGEPRPDGSLPPLDSVAERAAWWAEIFETPCAAYAPGLDTVAALAATGAEFVALGDPVWSHPEGPGAAIAEAAAILSRIAAESTP